MRSRNPTFVFMNKVSWQRQGPWYGVLRSSQAERRRVLLRSFVYGANMPYHAAHTRGFSYSAEVPTTGSLPYVLNRKHLVRAVLYRGARSGGYCCGMLPSCGAPFLRDPHTPSVQTMVRVATAEYGVRDETDSSPEGRWREDTVTTAVLTDGKRRRIGEKMHRSQ